jgi:hypothetical protein
VRCGRGEIDGQQDGPEMALKLGSQTIDMVPLKRGFVEAAMRGDMVGGHIELLAFENAKGLGLDVLEGRLGGNTLVSKEFEDVPGFGEVLVAFEPRGIHPVLGGVLRRVHVLSDVMNQAVEHMVMEALIPVVHKTQEVQIPHPDIQALQPVDGIVCHQGGVVFNTFGGNVELWSDLLRQAVQAVELLPALPFVFHGTGTEIFRLTLELREGIQAWSLFEEVL